MRYAQKLWKSFLNGFLGCLLALSIFSPIWANDAAFDAGKATANAGLTQLQNLTSVQGASSAGVQIGQSAPALLTNLYKGGGKNGADAIGNLHQQGLSSMQASQQNCAAGDGACNAMKTLGNSYTNAVNGIDPTSAYKARAKAIQEAQSNYDPLAILGIGIPAQNGGNVCVNSTATAPSYQASQSCMQAIFQTIKYTPVLPVTSTITTASPYCIDPSMTLTANQALCTKTTYSCPSGGTLNGQQCTETTSLGYDYTSPYCIDPSMTMRGDKSLCEKQTYSCPNGGTLNGTQCVITSSPNVSYSGCSTAQSGGSWTQYIVNGRDWRDVQAMCSPDGQNIQIYANAAGRDGNGGTAGYWESLPIANYSNRYTHISTPHWKGSLQAYATAVRGGCSGGICSYNISFDWANFGISYNECLQCEYRYNSDTYEEICIRSNTRMDWFHTLNSEYGCGTGGTDGDSTDCSSTNADDVRNALANQWVQSGFTKRTTLTFPQNANYSCPSGGVVQNGKCVMTYPATASYTSAQPGCLGGRTFTGNSCQSVPVCPTGFSKISTTTSGITCSKTYPATANTSTASPGCYTPIIPAGAVSGGTQLAATMVNGQAGMTCQTTHYSCPAGMNMNGMMCEDPSTVNYANNPNCKRLGVNMSERTQGFLCINNRLDECAELDLTGCVSAGDSCVYVDDVVGSDTYNQCIATEKKYTCTKPQQTANISRCGYEPMCYNGNCFTPPGTKCAPTATGDECTTDLSQVMVGLETSRQAGNYMTQDNLKLFSGEADRCDRRAASVLGAGIGSKSCCNIDSVDAKSNSDVLTPGMQFGRALVMNTGTQASKYVFDYMMSSSAFQNAGQAAWGAGLISDGTQASIAGANPTFNPASLASYSPIAGLSIGFGGSAIAGASTTTNLIGMTTKSYSFGSAAGGLQLQFTPMLFYVAIAMKVWQMYNEALQCDETDYKTATKNKGKLCYDTGTWCESKDCGLLGCTCKKYRTGKCCFNSKLARIINQQGRVQLGLNMRDCDGFTVAQIQQLDWSRIDLSEFIADTLAQAQASTSAVMSSATQGDLQNKIKQNATRAGTSGVQPSLPVLKPSPN